MRNFFLFLWSVFFVIPVWSSWETADEFDASKRTEYVYNKKQWNYKRQVNFELGKNRILLYTNQKKPEIIFEVEDYLMGSDVKTMLQFEGIERPFFIFRWASSVRGQTIMIFDPLGFNQCSNIKKEKFSKPFVWLKSDTVISFDLLKDKITFNKAGGKKVSWKPCESLQNKLF